jgi:hypothetical protein
MRGETSMFRTIPESPAPNRAFAAVAVPFMNSGRGLRETDRVSAFSPSF